MAGIEMAEIFLSYRRFDSAWAAGRICDRLERDFGDGRIFFDTIAIQPGDDFVEVIGAKVEACRVLVAVIGEKWLELLNARIEIETDYLRIELIEALRRGVRIIPALIDGATMPSAKQLPDELKPLARRHAQIIRSETFHNDMNGLSAFLTGFLNSSQIPEGVAGSTFADQLDRVHHKVQQFAQAPYALEHKTQYWKRTEDGKDRWKIFISLSANPEGNLDQVERVVYYLHPTFKNPVREISDRASNFALRTNGWGEFELAADVYLQTNPQPFRLTHYISFLD